ncbi:MAG: 2OG-Fe(II) oxygenase [Luteibaculum sp.]
MHVFLPAFFYELLNEHVYEKIIDQLIDRDFAVSQEFSPSEVLKPLRKQLKHFIKENKLRQAGIGQGADFMFQGAIRNDQILWLDEHGGDSFQRAFFTEVNSFTQYLNRTCFTGIKQSEFHFAHFKKGAFFKRHLDCFANDDSRKFSVVTYLNPKWDETKGGELVIFWKGEEVRVLPAFGTTVIFRSNTIEHEVKPALKSRYSITGWLK